MKVAIICQSLLLSRALKSFLGEKVVTYKQCDFVISDKKIELDKPIFFLNSKEGELSLPFSKASLLLGLERYYQTLCEPEVSATAVIPADVLEDKIVALTEKFRQELILTLREYYGN